MKLILGLGNPEDRYAGTRHNFGFRVLDALREKIEFTEWKLDQKFKAEVSEGKVGKEKVLLVKPQTFVNLSGEAARALLDFYKPHIEHFIVVHDDIDLPFGTIRIREGGSSGGHNGIKNLIAHFGTENFPRIRLGTANALLDTETAEEFVLQQFAKDEEKELPKIIEQVVAALEEFLQNGIQTTMNKFNS